MMHIVNDQKDALFENRQTQAIWFDSKDPLGSAVSFLASACPRFNWVGIYLLHGDVLELGPYIGEATDHKRIPVGRGICGRAVAENQDLNIADVHQESNYLSCSLKTQAELVVLIYDTARQVVGQIDIDSHSLGKFTDAEVALVKSVASVLGTNWKAVA